MLILDEPTSGLDPIGRRQVKDLIRALADRGKTVLLSSHLLAEVEDVCSRVCILHEGRLCAAGVVDELLKEADRMRIEFPAQDKAALESLLAGLRSAAGEAVLAEPARRSLERFFLEAIDSANRTGGESSERLRFKGLAPFLTSGGAET